MTALWSASSRQRRKTVGSGQKKLQGQSRAMDWTTTRDVCGGELSTGVPTGSLPDCSRGYYNRLDATAENTAWTNFIRTYHMVKFLAFSVRLSLSFNTGLLIIFFCYLTCLYLTSIYHFLFFYFLSFCLLGLYSLANSTRK
jgi:hypothetical protein